MKLADPNAHSPALHRNLTLELVRVTERAAICLYLTERFPDAKLAPAIGDTERAAFLTWLVYCDSVFDPTLAAHAQDWKYQGSAFSFGSFEDMVANLERTLSARSFAAGERFTAADTQLASGVYFGLEILKALPDRPV